MQQEKFWALVVQDKAGHFQKTCDILSQCNLKKTSDFLSQCFSLLWSIPLPWRSSLLPKPRTHIMLIWTQGNLSSTDDPILCAYDSNELKMIGKGKVLFSEHQKQKVWYLFPQPCEHWRLPASSLLHAGQVGGWTHQSSYCKAQLWVTQMCRHGTRNPGTGGITEMQVGR